MGPLISVDTGSPVPPFEQVRAQLADFAFARRLGATHAEALAALEQAGGRGAFSE